MLQFQTIDFSMRGALNDILYRLPEPACEYSFANLLLWGPQRVAVQDGFVFVMTHHSGADSYLFPAGTGDPDHALRLLAADAVERRIPFAMYAVTDGSKALLEQRYPDCFCFYEVRNGADYIYDIQRLADLKGRKLQAKRNHIHRFEDACPDWQAVPITAQTLPDCRRMVSDWYRLHEKEHPGASFSGEVKAISTAFAHYEELGFDGLLLTDGRKVLAVTMGNRIRQEVFDVNFEKAYGDLQGDYAMINREFARYLRQKYPRLRLLNREDDMGLEGLRKAKLSYYPDVLLRKWVAVGHPERLL